MLRSLLFGLLLSTMALGSQLLSQPPSGGPFSPSQVAGLKAWYRGDDLAGSDGTNVTAWTDQSSNGYNITGASATPPIRKLSIINGHEVVRFNGATPTSLTGTGSAYGNLYANNAFSVWFVFQASAIVGTTTAALNPYANDMVWGTFFFYVGGTLLNSSGTYQAQVGNFVAAYTSTRTSTLTLNTPYIVHNRHDSGNAIVSINNGTEASVTSGNTASNTDTLLLGGGGTAGVGKFTGDLAEILIYNTAVGSTDRTKIWNYLNAKYAVY